MGNEPSRRRSGSGSGGKKGWYSMGEYSVNLMDKLGQGSYGVVYRGKEKKSGKTIAVKQIMIKQEEQGSMALGEIKNLKKLPQHPNLVQYRGYHYHTDSFWIAMEFCDLGDLSDYYKTHYPKIPLAHQIHFMYQISSSVTHLHSLRSPIIHRDIKPANVMLCKNRHGYPIVKLTDFGISKISEEGMNPASSYLCTTVAGTPMYMAPEFFVGENPSYGRSVDVFAMGMLYLCMLQAQQGKPLLSPKTEGTPGQMSQFPIGMRMCMAQAQGGPAIKLVEHRGDDPPAIKQVKKLIMVMCDTDPHKRPKAGTVTDVLGECLESVKSALDSDVLEGTSSGLWLVQQMSGGRMSRAASGGSGGAEGTSRSSSSEESGSGGTADAIAYLLIQEALKSQMGAAVRQRAEEEELEDMPLMELLRLVSGPSHREEVDRFQPGELVRIDDNEKRVEELQDGYGGWIPAMKKYLGRTGKVTKKVLHVYKVKFADGVELSFNPEVLEKLEGSDQLVAGIAHALEEAVLDASDPIARKFKRFTVVEVIEDSDKLEALQTREHGGFSNKMILACGVRGIVNKVSDGSVYVECINGDDWWFNPGVLTIVETDDMDIEEGDFVVISNSEELVKEKQKGHGGWNPAMEKALGSAGIVKAVSRPKNVAEVETTGRTWVFNLQLLRHVARGEDLFAAIMKKRLLAMLVQ